MPKSYSWDYDNKKITEWLRLGSCNHCGECCEVAIYLIDTNLGVDYTNNNGVWHQAGDLFWGDIRITSEPGAWNCYEGVDKDNSFIDAQGKRCEATNIVEQQRGQCGLNPERKRGLCEAWPLHPEHVSCFDNCSFKFVKLNEWELTDGKELVKEVC